MEIVIGFVSLGLIVLSNLGVAIWKFGRLEQRVEDMATHMNHLSDAQKELRKRVDSLMNRG